MTGGRLPQVIADADSAPHEAVGPRMTPETLRSKTAALVREIQSLPYLWPTPPDAASARQARAGSCAAKHALLAEELEAIGVDSLPLLVVGPLVPRALTGALALPDDGSPLEVHECLTVTAPWAGPLRVDVTWDPPLVAHGLPATLALAERNPTPAARHPSG